VVGLVVKHFAFRKLTGDNLIALHGEAGYQAELLMPGLHWRRWPLNKVVKFPWMQVPAGEIGVVTPKSAERWPRARSPRGTLVNTIYVDEKLLKSRRSTADRSLRSTLAPGTEARSDLVMGPIRCA
jgi:hypothetical protein